MREWEYISCRGWEESAIFAGYCAVSLSDQFCRFLPKVVFLNPFDAAIWYIPFSGRVYVYGESGLLCIQPGSLT
jgi:hypothetical protein